MEYQRSSKWVKYIWEKNLTYNSYQDATDDDEVKPTKKGSTLKKKCKLGNTISTKLFTLPLEY